MSARDQKLIHYLAKHNHWSPFAHTFMSFRIKAPIFVARQLVKHQVGLAWNEVSRRYVDTLPEFYEPEVWRQRSPSAKQGSLEAPVEDLERVREQVGHLHQIALTNYGWLLAKGVCPEQARMILPQSTMTEWIWSGTLYAFARVCKLRLDRHTQAETRDVAKRIDAEAKDLFPVSWGALRA
jgi:thymidylate synthase (FAD)